MTSYAENVIARYLEVGGLDVSSLKRAETPFLDEAKDPSGVEQQPQIAKLVTDSAAASTAQPVDGFNSTAGMSLGWSGPTCGAAKKTSRKLRLVQATLALKVNSTAQRRASAWRRYTRRAFVALTCCELSQGSQSSSISGRYCQRGSSTD